MSDDSLERIEQCERFIKQCKVFNRSAGTKRPQKQRQRMSPRNRNLIAVALLLAVAYIIGIGVGYSGFWR